MERGNPVIIQFNMKIGLLSDTHGWLDERVLRFFQDCDEVWHCGDIGDITVLNTLMAKFKVRAVYGNIDGGEVRRMLKQNQIFECEGMKVLMTHIGGYPGHYDLRIRSTLLKERPQLFLCGHSHILKVMYDKSIGCMHMNPGAAGKFGFHRVCTALRFKIEVGSIKDLEILEFDK